MREIVLDIETTGLSFKNGDRVIEIGCVELLNKEFTGNIFHRYVNPERDISYSAYKVHGLSSSFLKNYEIFADIANDFLSFVNNDVLVIHNSKFDVPFLNFELNKLNLPNLNNKIIDTLNIARQKFPGEKASLDALCKKFKIDISGRKLHGALKDSMLLAKLYFSLKSSSQSLFIFPNEVKNNLSLANKIDKKMLHIVKPSQDEIEKHKKFLTYFLL